ncbi:glycosyltransferase family 4 protein [Shewanella basaltis]|uniref:glycosyltransferase family 4 protein n=1 Tax=Shewanella basaltis TaxID=472183 RepID=UPI002010985A|nr:glycosyltransferase family 4 protein [Shewanella basaltis]MCL1113611.1 glycosyltransferase family 4 protein [Shewanella basaltis]
MKVVHVVRQFLPSVGGLEDVVFNLAKTQIDKGHSVEVYTLNSDFQSDKVLAYEDDFNSIVVKRFPWFGSKRYSLCILPLNELNKFDVIHVHAVDFFVEYLSFLKRLRLLKPKLVLTTHGGFFHTNNNAKLKRFFFKYITPFSLSQFDVVTCCSVNDYELFKSLNKNVVLIENGVGFRKLGDIKNNQNLVKSNDFIYFGRFSDNKRIPLLIEFFSKLKTFGIKLKVIGRSNTGDIEVIKQSVKIFNADNVELILDQSDDIILGHIKTARFTVSASEYEGFGLSIIELMSYGLVPLLSSNPPSFKRFIEESKCGAIFDTDSQSFTKALEFLCENWSLDMESLAINYSRTFSWDTVSEKYLDVYQ